MTKRPAILALLVIFAACGGSDGGSPERVEQRAEAFVEAARSEGYFDVSDAQSPETVITEAVSICRRLAESPDPVETLLRAAGPSYWFWAPDGESSDYFYDPEDVFDVVGAVCDDDNVIGEALALGIERWGGVVGASAESSPTPATGPAAYNKDTFNSFMEASLEGTSYSYGPRGSIAWDTSARVYEYAAESICGDLARGGGEASLRAEIAEVERLDDPDLDQDIPTYIDAIFIAAKTIVCP